MYKIIQFSPTGNAAYLANQLAMQLGTETEVHALEHSDPSKFQNVEHLIIVFAIHGFNAPRNVKRFVDGFLENTSDKVSLIGVGCNTSWMNDAVSKDIRKILKYKTASIVVDEVVAMPLTFIMSFPDDVAIEQVNEAKEKIKDIAIRIKKEEVTKKDVAFKSQVVNFLGKSESFAARFFGLELHIKKGCTQCGLCVRECPEKNIRMNERGKIHFGFNCLMCMRCIYNCPEGVITPRISKFIPIKKGYKVNKYIGNK